MALHPKPILCYRASLALPLKKAFGISCTGHPFHLLERNQFLQNLSNPRVFPQWSLNTALQYYSNAEAACNETASRLSLKVDKNEKLKLVQVNFPLYHT